MGIGVHQHIRTGVTGSPLHRLDVATRDHQLIGGTGMPQTVEHDAGKLRVCILPFQELFGSLHRDRAFDEDAPLHRQQKGIVQQLVDLMEGGAGEGALLLLGREVSPLAAHILSAGGLAQGVVQGFDVVGSQLLHLHLPDIRDDEVLDERQIGLVGLGCPLVLAALLGQPVHQELCHRHRGRDQEVAGRQLMLDLLLAFHRLLFGGKAFPFVAALAVLVLIGVAEVVACAYSLWATKKELRNKGK